MVAFFLRFHSFGMDIPNAIFWNKIPRALLLTCFSWDNAVDK